MLVLGKEGLLFYNWFQDVVANALSGKMYRDIKIKQSVGQGSFLGPRLYMLYIHDLPVHLLDSKVDPRIGCCIRLTVNGWKEWYMSKSKAVCGIFPIILVSPRLCSFIVTNERHSYLDVVGFKMYGSDF